MNTITPEMINVAKAIKTERGGNPDRINAMTLARDRKLLADVSERMTGKPVTPSASSNDKAPSLTMMNAETILELVNQVKPGDKIKFRFDPSAAPADMSYLRGMESAGVITMSSGQTMIVMAVTMSRDWDGDHNKVVEFTAGDNWDANWFWERAGRRSNSFQILG